MSARYTQPSRAEAVGWGNPGYWAALYDDVWHRRVPPRQVVGTGYINARRVALDFCASQTYREPFRPAESDV
jgi:hypothetical protein